MKDHPTHPTSGGNWDFETGDLSSWLAEGDAFRNQPVHGDRVSTARVHPVTLGGDYWDVPYPIGHHGDYWIGSAENALGDMATGTLVSLEFLLSTRYIHFLISGTQDLKRIRVELQARSEDYARLYASARDHPQRQDEHEALSELATPDKDGDFVVLFRATGHDSETMRQETWDLAPFLKRSREAQVSLRARIRIIDASQSGHINVDHFQFLDHLPEPVTPPLWGFADLHCHPMAHLGCGGHFIWGKPTDPVKKLQRCDGKGHGGRLFSGYVLHEIEAKDDPGYRANRHSTCCWPNYTSRTHQEMHIDWIRRAYEGGLRLMCACAVNNQLIEHFMRISPLISIKPRDDLSAVLEQIEAMKKLAEQQASWMAVAYSPAQARQIIAQRKLAIVLAVEVDQLGGWKDEQDCTDAQVAMLLQTLYNQGIRMLIPIHLADNAFGGTALYLDTFNGLNFYLNGEYFSVEDGYHLGVQFRLQDRPERTIFGRYLPRVIKEDVPIAEYLHIPPGHGHVNRRGLTDRGRFLIHAMIRKGMLIDIDHMSHRSVEETLSIAERYDYPLVASHCTFRELARQEATEGMKTRQQVDRIARLGGMIGPMPTQEDVRDVHEVLPDCDSKVPNDYPASSKSWAQAYLYALYLMRGKGVALGTDFNGLVIKPRPRFPAEPGGQTPPGQPSIQSNRVRYAHYTRHTQARQQPAADPLTRHHTPLTALDEGAYDINLMGLAHYGMLPDFLQDGRNIGLTEQDLAPLFRSAHDYIQMWEKCERRSRESSAFFSTHI